MQMERTFDYLSITVKPCFIYQKECKVSLPYENDALRHQARWQGSANGLVIHKMQKAKSLANG